MYLLFRCRVQVFIKDPLKRFTLTIKLLRAVQRSNFTLVNLETQCQDLYYSSFCDFNKEGA